MYLKMLDKTRQIVYIYNMENDELYTLKEVSKILKVSEKTVYRLIESGKLKAVKIRQWRIKKSNLDKLINT